jgi:hyperosmotically inducible protein
MFQKVARWLAVTSVLTIACAQSDAGITTAVKSKLAADATVKAFQINVDTADHVVTLTGTVDSSVAKANAIQIASRTDGVRNVIDRLDVSQPAAATTGDVSTIDSVGTDIKDAASRAGTAVGDAAITTDVKSKFIIDSKVSAFKIDVDTKDGVVTLSGMVPSKAEADHAELVARDSAGVKSVVNHLRIGGK